ncbi:hypothetical protein E3P92_00420 [Wallemia ichthyophaga]|uniref:TATA-binding protein-associated factor mot1 n=1 Tax=Wallemia ichthyophaga (strain EXF-994 / CBS 113033) TaxID=1299270 RepID=R9ALP3_WALI9|nr:putative helicase mot1 [Wallemia ichthyophaga EXF-994]TIA74911.1 hypothetical protein E3P91_00776 [Wallemia ichthyophaga]EOR00991.1 putative helicase mot1 [Wallemia ichthyophaga EXF-994]TIA94165.1 hypothetical protein E3P97_00382 [Wallemia ichthyophaga]TIB03742.1 hypothetical protein E3P95_00486 [Wallemia ichthyophaga]TIB05041.1 hypothetical protein E3P94_00486 [Wallemia ichthyophaga]
MSRLDKLIQIIETGSTPSIKQTAAKQLGQISKLSVGNDDGYVGVEGEWIEAVRLIFKILPHLRSKNWDTRIAASLAIESILKLSGTWKPFTDNSVITANLTSNLRLLNVNDLSQNDNKLLASTGQEYASLNTANLQSAKSEAANRLGLGFLEPNESFGFNVEDELSVSHNQQTQQTQQPQQPSVSGPTIPQSQSHSQDDAVEENMSALSARERNRLKRKRKLGQPTNTPSTKVRVNEPNTSVKVESTEDVKPSQESLVVDPKAKAAEREAEEKANKSTTSFIERPPGEYPFGALADVMQLDLLSSSWELRHGAAVGLRELFKIQGAGGGMIVEAKPEDNSLNHTVWMENMAANVLCVLILDRFGDFISDQVVCPVRETASQTLASLVLHMDETSTEHVHTILHTMIYQSYASNDSMSPAKKGDKGFVWEVRHAGLLGLKYFVAVKKNQLDKNRNEMLRKVVDAVILGLNDSDDDVRAVAASTLQPIVGVVMNTLFECVPQILDAIWDSFTQLKDDLCSSTGIVMGLLAEFIAYDSIMEVLLNPQNSSRPPLPELISRLYPFFRHTIASVRIAVVHTLIKFVKTPTLPNSWIDDNFLRFVYQNVILEERSDIRNASLDLFHCAVDNTKSEEIHQYLFNHLQGWFAIVMTPIGLPMDSNFFVKSSGIHNQNVNQNVHNIDKNMMTQDLSLVSVENILKSRYAAVNALARILADWPSESQEVSFCGLIPAYVGSTYALHQQLAAALIEDWATFSKSDLSDNSLAKLLKKQLVDILLGDTPTTYSEMGLMLSQIRNECQIVYSSLINDGKLKKDSLPSIPNEIDPTGTIEGAFSLSIADHLMGVDYDNAIHNISSRRKNTVGMIDDRKKKTMSTIQFYKTRKDRYDTQVYAAVAAAVVALKELPAKLNPVIRSIMNSIKTEDNMDIQQRAARALANLIELCCLPSAKANPSEKIIKNLCTFACQNESDTPIFTINSKLREGSMTLMIEETEAKVAASANQNSKKSVLKDEKDLPRITTIQRGALQSISEFSRKFGQALFDKCSKLYDCMASFTDYHVGSELSAEKGQEIVDSFTIFRMVVENVDSSLHFKLLELLPNLCQAMKSNYAVIRYAAGKSLASICKICTNESMLRVVDDIVPFVGDSSCLYHRQGSLESIHHIVSTLETAILPYVLFLVVPVLGRVSDADDCVRKLATSTFATLVKLVPLEAGLPDPVNFPERLLVKREEERKFLTQLLDGSKVEEYEIPIKLNIDLRKYQREGISWLAFLNKYQLHGILCDDMGLGKTLQSITILASLHHERAMKHEQSKSADTKHLPSLVICPPTLTGHWKHEVLTYANNIKPLLYTGGPSERIKLRKLIPRHDVVIMSYDVVRNDITDLGKVNWLYCILDEGHVIKNTKTKLTKAVKEIRAHHRLLLSGTPVQNNVLELWSLFDFLMPGFLGSEKHFNDKFGKVIFASREAKASSKEQEAANNALKILHKQILPFIMRRLKEDVLDDLPPKIIQDYYCDLSELQQQLYEEFGKSSAADDANQAVKTDEKGSQKQQHVFQALQYLRKLCNHPSLIFNEQNAKHKSVIKTLESKGGNIRDVNNAPKLLALRQLLQDCGIGETVQPAEDSANVETGTVAQHRVLIFCQMKQMLDIVENDLLRKLMPSVSFMRLDGQTPADSRHSVVQKFNQDPSIDVLLLTTHVGGLGLNLTGADTVIFVEHDWNPQRDLQAMDRAHRLGQKKTVNVYRLITRGTLEEKIMGLQRFKLNVANSIVTQQNNSLDTMDTGQVLDLFSLSTGAENESDNSKRNSNAPNSQKNMLEGLEDLPPEDEYESLDVNNFISSM